MSDQQNIAVFVAWPYANANTLHIGHLVGAILPSDIFARFNRMKGHNVLHVTGTDMHGTPVSIKAQKANQTPEEFALSNHSNFVQQLKELNIDFDLYTNTHNKNHYTVVNNIGKFLYKKGFLFPKKSKMFYDTQKKRYLPDRYVEGTCPYCGYSPARGDQCDNCGRILAPLELIDPISKLSGTTPTIKEVTNLYLDLPKVSKQLNTWIKSKNNFRKHVKEMTLGFLNEGLKPRPITRNMDWGIKVDISGFEDQVWYVWFEAVIGYLSAAIAWDLEKFPENMPVIFNKRNSLSWEDFWKSNNAKHYYFLGKDNIPFHTIIWPAQIIMYNYKYASQQDFETFKLPDEKLFHQLLLAYDVPANNFLNMNSAKISKSTGNYIGVSDLLKQYDSTMIRYVFSRLMPETKDSDFNMQKFKNLVNNELVATIGNLIYRSLSFAKKQYNDKVPSTPSTTVIRIIKKTYKETDKLLSNVKLSRALERILGLAQYGNKLFNDKEPWKSPQTKISKQTVTDVLNIVYNLAILLYPFTPELSNKIFNYFSIPPTKTKTGYPKFTPSYLEKHTLLKEINIPVKKLK